MRWVAGLLMAASACAPSADLYPDRDWPLAGDVAALGTSRERLGAYEAWLKGHAGGSWASVILKDGHLVYEGAGPRSHVREKNDCGSILKPLQATVLGAALVQGRLKSLDENAIPYWKDPYVTPYENDREITFRQFAQYHDRWNSKAPPGTFHYNNAGATAAGACIAGLFVDVRGPQARGMAGVARREVMEKIGADWDLGHWDRPFSNDTGNPGPRMVLESSVTELAKLGYLWLRQGLWRRARIFSQEYYREAVTDGSPSTGDTRFGYVGHYGYGWFVNRGNFLLPDVPGDAFYAIGNGNPKRATALLVLPDMGIVAVLSMERVSDEGLWDVILNSRLPSNEGPRLWAREVARLHAASTPP